MSSVSKKSIKRIAVCLGVFMASVAILTACENKNEGNITTETTAEHEWLPANYQHPKICADCGATEGEPLTASFELHGLNGKCDAIIGQKYDYITVTMDNPDVTTSGTVSYSNFRVFDNDETHTALDGYEWRGVTVEMEFSDANAQQYGMQWDVGIYDYYDMDGADESREVIDETTFTYTVNYYGVDYKCTSKSTIFGDEWVNGIYRAYMDICIQVPTGYDGVCIGVKNPSIVQSETVTLAEVASNIQHFFRMK